MRGSSLRFVGVMPGAEFADRNYLLGSPGWHILVARRKQTALYPTDTGFVRRSWRGALIEFCIAPLGTPAATIYISHSTAGSADRNR